MAKTDPTLGKLVQQRLIEQGLETLIPEGKHPRLGLAAEALRGGVLGFLNYMNLDISDPSITNTPDRVAEMFTVELCAGLNYDNFPKCTVSPNMNVDEMVMVSSINTVSLCEHHFQTISGVTHVAYIPGGQLLGLSKFARVVDFFARRPQVQERMTEQVYAALSLILDTEDVAVQQVCTHNCMRARGVMDPHSKTTTSKMGGKFRSNQALREEFLASVKGV